MCSLEVYDQTKQYVDIHGVRITPPKMDFTCAFEGRTFKCKLTIQNIGKTLAFIRITSPTSYAYTVKTLPRGKDLPPGLSIERYVELKYTQVCVRKCSLPIYINECRYDLPLQSFVSTAELTVVPNMLDFGCVNAGLTSKVYFVQITNTGSKPTKFYIDVPRNQHEVIAEPIKGFLQANTSLSIKIRLMAYKEGVVNTQLWVRGENPTAITIRALVINATFEAFHPNATSVFTLVDFPPTYTEATYTRNLFVRNYSALTCMFCVLGELPDGRLLSLKSCRNIKADFKYFKVLPSEGRLEPKETKLFQIDFRPKEAYIGNKRKTFHFVTIQICKVEATDLHKPFQTPIFSDTSSCVLTSRPSHESKMSLKVEGPVCSAVPLFNTSSSIDNVNISFKKPRQFVRVYLHGIVEEPSVTITPDELILNDLILNTKTTRVLELQNNSSRLPIILHYKKVPHIDLYTNIFLKPSEKKEISVLINYHSAGLTNTQIAFDLAYHHCPKTEDNFKVIGHLTIPVTLETIAVTNYPKPILNNGISPNYIKEVGKFCDGVKYSELTNRPKAAMLNCANRSCNIALPNDRQQSMRPWRNKQCQTIFTKTPRYVAPLDPNYELSLFDREFKRLVTTYYTNYTRKEAEKLVGSQKISGGVDEYPLTDDCKILYNDFKMHIPAMSKVSKGPPSNDCFIPLTPMEMNNISISPTIIETGRIASHHKYNFFIVIRNSNPVSLRIFLKPDKPTIFFPHGDRMVIAPFAERKIDIIYSSSGTGYYLVSIDVIINESTISQVMFLADVVPYTLNLSTTNIILEEGCVQTFIDIVNNLNVVINFFWSIPFDNFTIVPVEGIVRANSTITCILSYYSHISGPNIVDLEFHSGCQNIQFVRVECEIMPGRFEFITKEVVFNNISLNKHVTRQVVFRNHHKQALSFTVLSDNLPESIEVKPEVGVVEGNQMAILHLSATFKSCEFFDTDMKLNISKVGMFSIPVKGNVIYPTVSIVPDQMQFKRVPFSSCDLLPFSVTNTSLAAVTIRIDMSDYQEFVVSAYKHHWLPPLSGEITLEPEHMMSLFIHYVPLECSMTQLYLPIRINNILGPPVYSDPVTTKTDYYMRNNSENLHIKRMSRPANLNLVKIIGLAIEGKVTFSKLVIDFEKGIRPNVSYRTKYDLKITNCQRKSEDVLIRTDDVVHPFYLKPLEGSFVENRNVVVCTLLGHQSCTINIEFQANAFGTYKCSLPVYLRSDESLEYHNVIQLRGTYTTPTISGEKTASASTDTYDCKQKRITSSLTFYSRPMPLRIIAHSTKKYIFRDHFAHCKITTYTNQPGLKIEILQETFIRLEPTDYELDFSFKFSADENSQFVSLVKIYCSCGGMWHATLIGCAENCFLTTYAFSETFLPDRLDQIDNDKFDTGSILSLNLQTKQSLMSAFDTISRRDIGNLLEDEFHTMEFFSSYPFFPKEVSALTIFLEKTLNTMELWLYNQVFFRTIRYQIPETISYVQIPNPTRSQMKICESSTFMIPPYAKILINLVGTKMTSYLGLGPPPKTEKETCRYLYKVYDRALSFIKRLGAYFICLKPEFLLEYNMYKVYKNSIESHSATPSALTVKNGREYYYLSKQFWLDLLLQTYKVLYLYRFNERSELSATSLQKCPMHPLDSFKRSIKDFNKYNNIYSNAELLLINWLQFHYNHNKNKIWGESDWLDDRQVNFFGENLQDGFVLAAVLAVYCPYLIPHVQKMYVPQDTFEELIHNNAVVVRCWEMLNCSFIITAEDIIDPNSVQLLMLIAYLYEVLPSMYPSETIEMTVGLSKTQTKTVILRNINDFPICYKVIFFSNEDGCFKTDKAFYEIPPTKTIKVKVTYFAKFARLQNATLLLSGEIPGYNYSQNKALTLVGTPDISYMTTTITYPITLYSISDVCFTIKSPYATMASYNMQLTYYQKKSVADLESIPIFCEADTLKLNRFMPKDICTTFDSDGLYELQAACIAIVKQQKTVWIYFRNESVGDFAICIVTEVKLPTAKEVLNVIIPRHISNIRVSAKKDSDQIYVEIPCQNKLLWNVIKEAMLKRYEGDICNFWKEKLDTVSGMQVLQQVALRSEKNWDAFDDICEKTVFRIITEKNCGATLPDTVIIENECVAESVKLPIRFDTYSQYPKNFNFTLESADGRKRRFYALNFIPR